MRRVCLSLASLALALLATGLSACAYTVTELPNLPGGHECGWGAQAINDKGWIVGIMASASNDARAVLWSPDGTVKDLGALPGDIISYAHDINNSGQIVGWSAGANNEHRRAVLWESDGKIRDLGTFGPVAGMLGGDISEARAINNKGWVVGFSYVPQGERSHAVPKKHAFLWKPDKGMVDLGTLPGGSSMAFDIDDSGRVVGYSYDSSGHLHAVMWEPDGTLKDLSKTFGLEKSIATAVNCHGQIAGKSGEEYGRGTAFLWDPEDGLTDLGLVANIPKFPGFINPTPVAQSYAAALNDQGQVVGSSSGDGTQSRAFVWTKDKGLVTLPLPAKPKAASRTKPRSPLALGITETVHIEYGDPGSTDWTHANGINNAGVIVGGFNGRAVVWKP